MRRLPAVVVLKPSGDVLTSDATDEIQRLGPACFANWQEAAELLDHSFLQPRTWMSPRRVASPSPCAVASTAWIGMWAGTGAGAGAATTLVNPRGMQVQGQNSGDPQRYPGTAAGLR